MFYPTQRGLQGVKFIDATKTKLTQRKTRETSAGGKGSWQVMKQLLAHDIGM